VVAEQADAYV